MVRKKKKRTRNKSGPSLGNLSMEDIRAKGELFLLQGKFKNALKCFKEILKQFGDISEIVQLLEQAYRGRIKDLAAKSLVKEAIVLLDVMEHSCGKNDTDSLRILLQIKAGNYLQAAKLFNECKSQIQKKENQDFEILFGALLLADSGLQITDFPEQSPVVRHYPLARSVLRNIYDNETEKAYQSLQAIPFRSPYRDFRIVQTGYLHWRQDKEKAAAFFAKIQPPSPYFRFATRFLVTLETPAAIMKKVAASSKNDEQDIRHQYSLSIQQFRLLDSLTSVGLKPVELYHIIKRSSSCFSDKEKRDIIRHIIPFLKDSTLEILPRQTQLSLLETTRLAALAAENAGALYPAINFWDDYLQEATADISFNITQKALIVRYQAKLMEMDTYTFSPEEILDKQLESLEFDPTHAETWLKAAKLAEKHSTVSRRYQIINDAIRELPDNVSILIVAMQAAGQRGAHKKAGKFAKQILILDPINISALDFLAESNLEHARKLTSQNKLALAEKELSKKDNRVKAVRLRGRKQICLGMIFLLQKKKKGLELIAEGIEANRSVFLGHLLVCLESRLFHLPACYQKRFDKELRQAAASPSFDRIEFLRLVSWLNSFTGKPWLYLKECSHLLKKYFSQTSVIRWDLKEGVSICQALDRAELYVALKKISGQLLKHFPEESHIKAYHLLGTYLKKPQRLTEKHHDEIYDLFADLEYFGSHTLRDRLATLLAPQGLEENDDILFIDDEIFKIPKQSGEVNKKTQNQTQPEGKQLDLFDFLE